MTSDARSISVKLPTACLGCLITTKDDWPEQQSCCRLTAASETSSDGLLWVRGRCAFGIRLTYWPVTLIDTPELVSESAHTITTIG